MEENDRSRSLEDILSAVEQDESLKGGEREADEPKTGASEATAATGGFAGVIPPELLLRLPSLLKAVRSVAEPLPVSDDRPTTPMALLCALRPYMNERRRRAVDAMIRISRLSDTLESLH